MNCYIVYLANIIQYTVLALSIISTIGLFLAGYVRFRSYKLATSLATIHMIQGANAADDDEIDCFC